MKGLQDRSPAHVSSETSEHPFDNSQAAPSIPPPAFQLQASPAEEEKEGEAMQLLSNGEGFASPTPPPDTSNNPVQRQIEGTHDLQSGRVQELKNMLVESGMMSRDETAPRHMRFLALLADEQNYSQDRVMEILGEMDPDPQRESESEDESFGQGSDDGWVGSEDEYELDAANEAPGGLSQEAREELENDLRQRFQDSPVRARIIWSGGNLTIYQIGVLREALVGLPPESLGDHADLAKVLHEKTKDKLGIVTADDIQQHLDQELEFAQNVALVEARLASVGVQAQVFRPANGQLLLPVAANQHIRETWMPFEALAAIPEMSGAGAAREILVTMGHGSGGGHTHFGAEGLLTQEQIGQQLQIPPAIGNAQLYVPLQCHPQAAVGQGAGRNWHSGSLETEDRITTPEVQAWLQDRLLLLIREWLG